MRWARLACFTGLSRLTPYFLVKLLLCGPHAEMSARSRNRDLGKGASPPSHINTTTILWRNKAWAEPGWYSGSARLIGLAHLIKTNKWMTLYFSRVHNSPLWPYETTKKLNSLNTKVMNNVNIKFKKGKNVLSILKRSGEIYSNLHMIKKLKYFKIINYEKNKSSKKQKKKRLPGVNLHITGFEFKKSGLHHCHWHYSTV